MSERIGLSSNRSRVPFVVAFCAVGALTLSACEDGGDKKNADNSTSASQSATQSPPVSPKPPAQNKYTVDCTAPGYTNWKMVLENEDMLYIIEKDHGVSYKTARTARYGQAVCNQAIRAADIGYGIVSIRLREAEKDRCSIVGLMPQDPNVPVTEGSESNTVIAACLPPRVDVA